MLAEFKLQARRLADHLGHVHGFKLKPAASLEALAAVHGARDWNTLSASAARAVPDSAQPRRDFLTHLAATIGTCSREDAEREIAAYNAEHRGRGVYALAEHADDIQKRAESQPATLAGDARWARFWLEHTDGPDAALGPLVRKVDLEIAAYGDTLEERIEARDRVYRDQMFPQTHAFWHQHAQMSMLPPKCLCCQTSTAEVKVAIRHPDLPRVVVCVNCAPRSTRK